MNALLGHKMKAVYLELEPAKNGSFGLDDG